VAKVKAVVVHTEWTDPDTQTSYDHGANVEVEQATFDRYAALGALEKTGTDRAKRAATTSAGLADPVKAQNPKASMTDVPGLKGDQMRADAGIGPGEPLPEPDE
jgi:hypothetical protein